ncbi:L,D-transpeptidase [Streptomyces sp. NPDC001941]|uniref:L,D-transpeptidase n=1 Tax=Streptomyces sp. NPDC001941 TaxID=3154659 RepID=UPI00332F35D6
MIKWTRAAAVLLCLGGLVAAAPPDPRPDPAPAPALAPVLALAEQLVPGVPLTPRPPYPLDTPDQALPPVVHDPGPEDEAEPPAPPAGVDDLVEYVPAAEAARAREAAASCTRRTGPHQAQVERWLGLKADGTQSPADCARIAAFQRSQSIRPAIGFAGPVTWARMRQLTAQRDPNADGRCPVRRTKVACVDLSRQLMWVQQGRKVVYGPVPVRSGRAGFRTRTGWHTVSWRHKNHWSSLYNSPMPYSQFFSGGQAFHGIYASTSTPPGSRGCVNLSHRDARRLWSVLAKGDRVYIWGRRPGT